MSTPNNHTTRASSFWRFCISRPQLPDWLLIVLCTIAGCMFMLWFFPYPSTTSDSGGYLYAAIHDQFIAYRPFGYSFFLQLCHLLSHSIFSVIVGNAILYALSAGLLLMAVKKYFPPQQAWTFRLLEALIVLSPNAIAMLDTVLSDTLFCSMVFVMTAMALVMIHEGSWTALAVYVLAFFAALHTRYSAMFFPLAFLPVLLMSGKKWLRIGAGVLTLAAFAIFYMQISSNMEQILGRRQFSTGFDGWQIANNAMHVLPHIDRGPDAPMPEDEEIATIHRYCCDPVYIRTIEKDLGDGWSVNARFLWEDSYPLKNVLKIYMIKYDLPRQETWVRLGSDQFGRYGKWLIRQYLLEFLRYYLLPNIINAFLPNPASSEVIGRHFDPVHAPKEFEQYYGSLPVLKTRQGFNKYLLPLLPWIELLTWLALIAAATVLLGGRMLKGMTREARLSLLLLFLFGFIYYGTTVFASPIAIRYWMPMHAVKLIFIWIVLSGFVSSGKMRIFVGYEENSTCVRRSRVYREPRHRRACPGRL